MGDGSFPSRLRDLLDPLGKKLGMADAVASGRIFERWASIVGADVAAHVEPTSLRDGVLRVRADSPTWATEIGYLATEIAERVNAAMGRPIVTELRVSAGPKAEKRPSQRTYGPPAGRAPRNSSSPPVDDPLEALERARAAWARKTQKRGSDQGF